MTIPDLHPAQLWQRDQTNCLRGIAALLILVFHVLIEWNMPRYVNLTGSVAVAMFLFLSGFGVHESFKQHGLEHYWGKKLKRIILPYALFVAIVMLLKGEFDWKTYLLDICFIRSSYWFIAYLVRCYLLYWVIQRFFPSHLLWLYALGGIVALNVFQQIEAEQSFSFFLGICASRRIDWLRKADSRWFLKVAAGCFLLGFFFLLLKEMPAIHAYKGTLPYHYILLLIKMPLAVPLLLLPALLPCLVRSRLLFLCGISSLEIYLVHLSVIEYMPEVDYLQLLLYLVFTAVCTWLFYQVNRLIQRIPLFT